MPELDGFETLRQLKADPATRDIPVVVVTSIAAGLPLTLGLAPKDMIMLALTFLVITVTLGTGRTHMMQGAVHLVIFGAFLFLTFVG
jgi:Ca2+:H+ antiporter